MSSDRPSAEVPRGVQLLRDPRLNKSTAFTEAEREPLGLIGLVPDGVDTEETQLRRVLLQLSRKTTDIDRYIYLSALQDNDETLYYKALMSDPAHFMPLVYTPTVGEACQKFGHILRRPRGLYLSLKRRGRIKEVLRNWPEKDVRFIVVTDGERILGIGDLGVNGMGIPVGKLALYTACAGIPPRQRLPVMLDVSTNNQTLLDDPLYIGYPRRRVAGRTYLALVDEFVRAVQKRYPDALIQFEDFLTPNAYALLNTYRDRVLCFNDDIQGTAAVALAGVYASSRITGRPFRDLRIMFLGAGSAATGIADLMTTALVKEGPGREDAQSRLWFVDKIGLVVKSRTDLMPHNLPYAHDHRALGFVEAIDRLKPHVLIGATGVAGTFTRDVVER